MNKFAYFTVILLFTMPALFLFGQQGTDALFLNSTTGPLNIGVSGTLTADTLFQISPAGKLSIYFYFQEDDPRNGSYTGRVSMEGGAPHLVFDSLLLTGSDSLTFGMIDTMPQGYLSENVFVRGSFRGSGGGENTTVPCPIEISCEPGRKGRIYLIFDPSVFLVTYSNPSSVFLNGGVNCPFNGNFYLGANYDRNALVISFFKWPPDAPTEEMCALVNNEEIAITIGGKNCVYKNGVLVNSAHCNSISELFSEVDANCSPYLNGCNEEIIQLLGNFQEDLQCMQWKRQVHLQSAPCNSGSWIYKPNGRVAIGTSGFAPNAALTVKNGILTNRMKVKLCDGSWCDYVFDPNYALMPLTQVEAFVHENKHLPGQPSGAIFESEGSFELGELTKQHQEKIEEVYLYLIDMDKRLTQLEQELAFLKAKQAWEVK
jgi:hypothetical protein